MHTTLFPLSSRQAEDPLDARIYKGFSIYTVFAKKNARNVVVVTRWIVFKLPRDGNVGRILREFALSWKAFLRGLSPPVLLVGPVLLRARVDLLKDLRPKEGDLNAIEARILELSRAGIEHRELRHPERHVGLWRGRWVFIDFDHARLSLKSRDLNKFRAWRRRGKEERILGRHEEARTGHK